MTSPSSFRAVTVCLSTIALWVGCARPANRDSAGEADMVAADTVGDDRSASGSTSQPEVSSLSYDCDREYRFVAQIQPGGEAVRLILPDTTVELPHVTSASGAKYGDGGFTYWSKGDEATIETPERSLTGCVSDEGGPGWAEAKERGVDFRAIGQEPGWLLDIHEGDSIAVTTDYGQAHYRFPPVEPEADPGAGRTLYRIETEAHQVKIVLEDEPCRDSMSGWPYEATVSMILNGREFDGCGRWF